MTRLLSRIPLRVKLVAAVLALVTAALTVIALASTFALRNYLVGRVDDQLNDTARGVNWVLLLNSQPEAPNRASILLPSDYVFGVSDPNGGWQPRVYDNKRLDTNDLPDVQTDPAFVASHAGTPYTARALDGSPRWRVLLTPEPNGQFLVVAQNLAGVDSALERLLVTELVVGGGVLVVLAVVGIGIVRASLRPLREIEHTAGAIAAGDLTQRVPDPEPGAVSPHTEVGRLSRALNAMLGQIEYAFNAQAASEAKARRSEEKMRQFVADASHELRTPLTTIRGFAELYRQGAARAPEQTADLMRRIEGEAQRMGLLVEDLLLLARLDRERPLHLGPVDLRVIASDAVEAARAVAPDRTVTREVPADTGPLVVNGDEARLRQVVGNLMTNALTHTPTGTPVWLRLARDREWAVVEVADEGPGLTPEQAERVFERFYRVDAARTRRGGAGSGTSGTGLGLAIVAALVAAHGGTVAVDSTPGRGATFRVRLPLMPLVDDDSADLAPQPPATGSTPDDSQLTFRRVSG